MRPITVSEIDIAVPTFYRMLLRERNGVAATAAMNNSVQSSGGDPFFVLTAEWMFMHTLLLYYNEMTSESQIAARVERVVVELISKGVPSAAAAQQRERLRAFLRDRRYVFDQAYPTFFFVDKHPEIADRFQMTYEWCFQEASGEVQS